MIAPGKLFWRFFLGNALLMAGVLAACFYLITDSLDRAHVEEIEHQLTSNAIMLQHLLEPELRGQAYGQLDARVKHVTAALPDEVRITVILPDGRVIADSQASPESMDSHAGRREVREALETGIGRDAHLSHTLSQFMRYVAVRIGPAESPLGVVRVAMAQLAVQEQRATRHRLLGTVAVVGLLATLLLAVGLARLWSRPIKLITETARSLSRGDLAARAEIGGDDELATLARSLNQMRDHLAAHLETIDRQRRTLGSLLEQLHEGVVVAGPDGRIVLINPAAMRLLGADGMIEGRAVEECIAQHDLQELLLPGPHPAEPAVREVRIRAEGQDGEIALLARGSTILLPTSPADGGTPGSAAMTGRLLVLTDVTELARMIQIKADFAANASHELRTPLSAIRAAVETLLQIDLERDAESAQHFLSVVDRHSSRLEAIVADLLTLSRIESSPGQFQPGTAAPRDIIADFAARHPERIEGKRLQLSVDIPPELATIPANPHLLRLVLENLLDNAIKFTDPGGRIEVVCRRTMLANGTPAVELVVSDNGCGIPEEDQARVFERFYQVERARSGTATRGTGLGLSIVRHAVAAMNGTVELTSRVGEGTRVIITLPGECGR